MRHLTTTHPGGLLAGLVVAAALCLASASGCQVALGGASCTGDSDCGEEQICAHSTCAETCSTDEDCTRAQTTCQPYFKGNGQGEINVCLREDSLPPDGPDSGFQCSNDQQCRQRLSNDRAECGLGRRCILPPRKRYSVLLRGQTPDGGGAADGAPGADIAAAFVTGPSERAADAFGWGRAVVYRPAGSGGGTSHLDGTRPSLDGDQRCVSGGFEESTTSLGGRGGLLLLKFVDDSGSPVDIEADSRIVVIEWGDNCGVDADQPDEYEAFLCVSESERIDPQRDCTQRLGRGSGYSVFTTDLDGSSPPG